MSDDIVTRLRRDCMSLIADEAADEIERLRRQVCQMSDERTEMLTAHGKIVETLTKERDEIQRELRKVETESSMLRVECGVIAKERDEAGGKVSDKQDIVDRLHNILLHEKDGLALTWLATCAANEIERLRAERDEARKSIRWLERNQIRLEEDLVPPADAEGTRWLKFVTVTSFSAQFLLQIGRSEAKRYFEKQDNLRRALSSAVDRDWDRIVAYAQDKPMEDGK